MISSEALRAAIGGIAANKLRSGLTILGLTIGVASVIVLVAVGNGSSRAVQSRIESLGSNVLLVLRGPTRGGSRASNVAAMPLTQADADALSARATAPDVASVSPVVGANVTMVAGGVSYSPQEFVGTTATYPTAHDYHVSFGSSFSSGDVTGHRRVLVIGPTVATNLFPGQNPVGRTVQVNGASFQVVGLTKPKGSNGLLDQDDIAMAPISAVQDTLTGYGPLDSITVQAKSRAQLDAADAEVTAILDQRHHVANPAAADFRVINQGSILAASTSTSQVFTTLLGAVAAISLVVGGNRRDEHHARQRHRADPRDRHSQGGRGAPDRRPLPVPLRGRAGLDPGWPVGCARRRDREPVHDRERPSGHRSLLDLPRLWGGRRHRPLLRHLPGQPGRRHAAHRGPAL